MLKTLSAVIYLLISHASVNLAFRVMVKNFVSILTSVLDQAPAESMLIVTICQGITPVCVSKVSRAIHTMDALILMNVYILNLVARKLYVQTSKAVIAATVLKVLMEMPGQQDALTIMNVPDLLAEETLIALMKLEHSAVFALKDLRVMQ